MPYILLKKLAVRNSRKRTLGFWRLLLISAIQWLNLPPTPNSLIFTFGLVSRILLFSLSLSLSLLLLLPPLFCYSVFFAAARLALVNQLLEANYGNDNLGCCCYCCCNTALELPLTLVRVAVLFRRDASDLLSVFAFTFYRRRSVGRSQQGCQIDAFLMISGEK